ncbi:MAG: TIGR04283 family arsenosugar biosynthesis glycosyltransferase [Planctomycetes bacterium]|nr:TIGR04283 family arsenosugar biosynthesis glycosyltransferase [Planctomycetota bacterium]MBI3846863.1 TIGR04283 family arsenosugar biosynthesis glycosyltransferase [Planctomycetota bacterium]
MISIVLPVVDEESILDENLGRLARQAGGSHEIVCVDGGSRDRSPAIASRFARVVASPRRRSIQMNTGAAIVRGDTLLFLHADSRLEDGALEAIERCLTASDFVGGSLSLRIDADGSIYRVIEAGANFRSRFLRVPYGDQGIFCTRDVFERIGGFRADLALMEDIDFSRRLARTGSVAVLPQRVWTSARRWQREGVARTIVRNLAYGVAYAVGIPPNRLAGAYYRNLGPPIAVDSRTPAENSPHAAK